MRGRDAPFTQGQKDRHLCGLCLAPKPEAFLSRLSANFRGGGFMCVPLMARQLAAQRAESTTLTAPSPLVPDGTRAWA